MQPNELQALVETAVRQGSSFSWLTFIFGVVGAAVGTFLASYLKRRGEDHAARENFAAIREQLQTTTRDTETIKQFLSSEVWRSQQQWATRERYYSSLLTHLQAFQLALSELGDYYMEPGSEHRPDSQQGEYFSKLLTVAHESHKEIQKLVGAAALYLSDKTVSSLSTLAEQYWTIAKFSTCTAHYVEEGHALASSAYSEVLREAKKHLNLQGGSE
jgi:type II secretory pathway pseudopilin PulG